MLYENTSDQPIQTPIGTVEAGEKCSLPPEQTLRLVAKFAEVAAALDDGLLAAVTQSR